MRNLRNAPPADPRRKPAIAHDRHLPSVARHHLSQPSSVSPAFQQNRSAMEPISFALAIVAEARTLGISVKNRIANYRTGPETFRALNLSVDRLANNMTTVESCLSKFPDVVPTSISDVFHGTFGRSSRYSQGLRPDDGAVVLESVLGEWQ